MTSVEDAIASKLRWIKLGSHRSRENVLGMLVGNHQLNLEMLRELSEKIGVESLFSELIPAAGEK